ncbi:Helix-turn-helix domain-containing protein [Faunimonas pinastri]|uniref:Helix-turn-helix domain-containing protein n=1 Tax=Faunimonas pinastri TaxID=1855383 RepID=A0A1H9E0K3_9HYPH|nr:AraC family transcriptional regulator [Faunimonas pinastri]SEQ19097.1 Helix-turn-helix domain-containing protein [Faunimonas pinastri]
MSMQRSNLDACRPTRQAALSNGKILSSAANGIADFILENGADPDTVLRTVGIEERSVRAPRESLELRSYCALIEAAAHHTRNDNFGLHFGQGFLPERLGLIGEIALASPTLGASLENLARYFPYHQQNTQAAFRKTGSLWQLECRILDGRIMQRRQDAELTMGMYLNVVRRCLGVDWAPDEVHFEHPRPENFQAHQGVFNAPVYFNMPTNALVFSDRDLQKPMPGWNAARMRDLCEALTVLTGSTGTLGLTDQVVGEIRGQLPLGYPHIENVAEALQMTRWTLQRRLADHDQIFSDLVERTRRDLAELYLRQAHMPLRDIADILGYSEPSAFSRACVRWFEAPPSRVRERLLTKLV